MVLPRMFLLLVLLGVAAASSAEWLVRSPQPRVDAGGVLEVEIILLNDTKTPVAGGCPFGCLRR
jgi:hypothetical protein